MATASKRPAPSKKDGSVNKAEAIRKAAKELGGKKVRPKDVIAKLAAEGVTVSSAQVSMTLRAAGYRKTRRAKGHAPPKVKHAPHTHDISLDQLLAAKALVGKLGGIEAAKKALDAWAKLA